MSRYSSKNGSLNIAYGYDNMIPEGGYFFQVFDKNAETEENEEGLIVDEGFVDGISNDKMLSLMTKYGVLNEVHLTAVKENLPI